LEGAEFWKHADRLGAGHRAVPGRAGNCYDNAFPESCIGGFKTEQKMAEGDDQRSAHRKIAVSIVYCNAEC
jgi:hypothetical protein